MSADLLPCPFCGSGNIHAGMGSSLWIVVFSCFDCRAIGTQAEMNYADSVPDKFTKAAAAWNTRAPVATT